VGGMIFYCIFKFLQWLYGWGEITDNTRQIMTTLSGYEIVVVLFALIGWGFIELPDIIKNWRKK
jgi:hypothetical protein